MNETKTPVPFTYLYGYYLLVTLFIVLPPVSFAAAGYQLSLRPGTAVTLLSVVVAEAAAICLAVRYFASRGLALRDTGWRQTPSVVVTVLAIGLAAAYCWFSAQLPEVRDRLGEVSWLKLWGVTAGVFGAIVEEQIFRGYLLARFDQAGLRAPTQIVCSAAIFGLMHLGWGWWGVVCTTGLGAGLAMLRVCGAQKSLWGPVICHVVINAVLEPWLLMWLLSYYARQYGHYSRNMATVIGL